MDTIFFYQATNKGLNDEFFGRNLQNNEKIFETEMYIDGNKLPLNNFIQETNRSHNDGVF